MITAQHQRITFALANQTGLASVKGQIITTVAGGYDKAAAGSDTACGVVLVGDIPAGGLVPICFFGRCQVLMDSGRQAYRGYWASLSGGEDGRALAFEGGSGSHAQGLGMVLESVAEIGALVWVMFCPSKCADIHVGEG